MKALEILEDRYGNVQSIISAHMHELLKLERIHNKDNVSALRLFYDSIESHLAKKFAKSGRTAKPMERCYLPSSWIGFLTN